MDSRGTQWYGYDPANQLNDAEIGATTTSYIYNGDGVRTARETSSTYTEYVIDHNRSLPVVLYDETAFYVWGLDLIARIVGSTQQYYHYDGPRLDARPNERQRHHDRHLQLRCVWQHQEPNGSGTNNFLFTGEWRDPETGFYFLRARYYDPIVGRFINRDPFPGLDEEPQSLNRYVYVQNNAVNLVDPSGLAPQDLMPFFLAGYTWQQLLARHLKIVNHAAGREGGRIIHIDWDPRRGWHVNADPGSIFHKYNHMPLAQGLRAIIADAGGFAITRLMPVANVFDPVPPIFIIPPVIVPGPAPVQG